MLLYRELMNFGLSEKEARVYLAALELGPTSVQKLAQKAGVNRATTYTNIDALQEFGLMGSFKDGKKIQFFAESPENAVKLLIEKQEMALKDRAGTISDLLPQLNSFRALSDGVPVVRYFEGHDSIVTLVREMFQRSENDILRIMYPHDLIYQAFTEEELNQQVIEREKRGIDFKAIYTGKEASVGVAQNRYFLPQSRFELGCDFAVFGDQVRIISLKGPIVGIVIEDKNIAESFKNIFDYIYQGIHDGLI